MLKFFSIIFFLITEQTFINTVMFVELTLKTNSH